MRACTLAMGCCWCVEELRRWCPSTCCWSASSAAHFIRRSKWFEEESTDRWLIAAYPSVHGLRGPLAKGETRKAFGDSAVVVSPRGPARSGQRQLGWAADIIAIYWATDRVLLIPEDTATMMTDNDTVHGDYSKRVQQLRCTKDGRMDSID